MIESLPRPLLDKDEDATRFPVQAKALAARVTTDIRQHGFAVIERLFDPHEIEEISAMFRRLFDRFDALRDAGQAGRFRAQDMGPRDHGPGASQPELLWPSTIEADLLDSAVFLKCRAFAEQLLGPVEVKLEHAILKPPRNGIGTPWHQDAQYASRDERWIARRHLHFWIPLQDATADNGCMEYISRSHYRRRLHHRAFARGGSKPGFAAIGVDPGKAARCPVALGGLTIHMLDTLHATGPNLSDGERMAWVVQFAAVRPRRLALRWLAGLFGGRR